MILPKDKEEMALLPGGKKSNFNKDYFSRLATILGLNEKQIKTVYKRIDKWMFKALALIDISFLSNSKKNEYKKLITDRIRF